MLALIFQVGGSMEVIEESNTRCSLKFKRKMGTGEISEYVATFTYEDAERANLVNKGVWKLYPRTMLKWRAVSIGAQVLFPDVTQGMYVPEEMNVPVNERGEMLHEEIKDGSAGFPDPAADKKRQPKNAPAPEPEEAEYEVIEGKTVDKETGEIINEDPVEDEEAPDELPTKKPSAKRGSTKKPPTEKASAPKNGASKEVKDRAITDEERREINKIITDNGMSKHIEIIRKEVLSPEGFTGTVDIPFSRYEEMKDKITEWVNAKLAEV